jgi:hypothetical protein
MRFLVNADYIICPYDEIVSKTQIELFVLMMHMLAPGGICCNTGMLYKVNRVNKDSDLPFCTADIGR